MKTSGSMTNFEEITGDPSALADFILQSQKEDPTVNWCKDESCCDDLDDEDFDCSGEMQKDCIVHWLNSEAVEKS